MSNKHGVKELLSFAKANGWSIKRTRRGHLKFYKIKGSLIFTSGTPSDWRSTKNAISNLKRYDKKGFV